MATKRPEPWLIHFFQRDTSDDPGSSVPAMDFLATVPVNVAAEMHAILEAVSEAPPPAFSVESAEVVYESNHRHKPR